MAPMQSSHRLGLCAALAICGAAAFITGCGGADDRPAKWSFIAPAIIEPNCATVSCHSSVAQRAGVILDSKARGYDILTSRGFVVRCQPGDTACQDVAADTSEIIVLMRGQGSPRMPPDFALPASDIDLIARWITNGATPE
jgi:hypothetical protein